MNKRYYGSSDRPGEVIVGTLIDKLREESDEWQTKYVAAVVRYEMEKQKLRLSLLISNKKCREQEMEIQKLRSTIEKMDSDYDDVPELVDSFAEEEEAAPCHRSRNSAKLSSHSDKGVRGSLQDCRFEGLQPSGFKGIFPELTDFDCSLLSDCDRLNNFPHRTGSEHDSRSDCGPPLYDYHSRTPNYSVIQDQRVPSQPSSRDFKRQVASHPTATGSLVSSLASRNFHDVPSRLPASKTCDSETYSLLRGQSFSGLLQKFGTSTNLAEEETSKLLADVSSIQNGCHFKLQKYW